MKKMKIVKQQDIKDCGVCCLKSIIEYYDGFITMEKLRLDTLTTSQGTNALNIIEAAKKYGFESMGIKADSLMNDAIKLPAIAHLNLKNGLEHFVVIYSITHKHVLLMDPARGKVSMPTSEFLDLWDNVLLLFYPKQSITIMHSKNSLFDLFLNIIKEEKKIILHIFIVSLILTIFTIISTLYFKFSLNSITSSHDKTTLYLIIILFSYVLIMKLLFTNIRKYLENHLNKNIDVLLLRDFLHHIFNLPLRSISSRTSGEIMTRINELMNIKSLFTEIFISCILDFLLMLGSIPILYSINHTLFFIVFILVLIYLIIGLITSKIIYKMAYRNIELEAGFNTFVLEGIRLIPSIKNLYLHSNILRKIESKLSLLLKDNFSLMNFVNKESNLKLWIYEIGLFLINTVGFISISNNTLSVTSLITFNTLVIYFLDPIRNMIEVLPKYNFLKATFTKINEFLNIDEEEWGEEQLLPNNNIQIKDLKYSYNNYNLIINNLSLEILSGEKVLLKGPSGCGKSTICKIINKHILEYEGNILIGGVNLKDYSIKTLRKNITSVSQDESLITGTIKENIMMGRNIDLSIFNKICSICQIEEIVNKKPFRYETIINNETSFISGGERQRIILARALLKDSPIYIIDEALSEVDNNLERNIIRNIKESLKDKTIIYITHKKQDDLFKKIINLEVTHGL